MFRKIVAVVSLVGVLAFPYMAYAQASETVLRSLGGGSWGSGGTRVLSAFVSRGAIGRVATVGLSSLASAGVALAVGLAVTMAEPFVDSGVDAVRKWMASAGAGFTPAGGWTKPGAGTPGYFASPGIYGGIDVAATLAAYQSCTTAANSHPIIYGVFPDSTSGLAWKNSFTWYNGGTAMPCSCPGFSMQAFFTAIGGQADKYYVVLWTGTAAVAAALTQNPPVPVPATAAEIKQLMADHIAAENALAKAAVVEAEDRLRKTLAGQPIAVPVTNNPAAAQVQPGELLDKPLPAVAGVGATPRAAATGAIAAQLPAATTADLAAADPAVGEQAVPPAATALPYTDPGYAGASSVEDTPWPEVGDFGARWLLFEQSIASSPIFGLPSAFFGGIPGGGSSTISFNAGVYGQHTYDFATWPAVIFSVVSGCVLLACGYVSVKIITIKGG